jgi:hypothetical protein
MPEYNAGGAEDLEIFSLFGNTRWHSICVEPELGGKQRFQSKAKDF